MYTTEADTKEGTRTRGVGALAGRAGDAARADCCPSPLSMGKRGQKRNTDRQHWLQQYPNAVSLLSHQPSYMGTLT